jgi:phosphate transport system ATP-binding protein
MITAIIGPSGCGKSTLLRCFNRMNDLMKGVHVTGHVLLDGVDILGNTTDLSFLRRRVGMVFQRPNPFPLSIFDNVTYGLRVHGETRRAHLLPVVESGLQATGLWDEVKDRLSSSALDLSPEQQQRL